MAHTEEEDPVHAWPQVVALFSATLPEKVEELARSIAAAPVRVTVGERNAAAASVTQRLVFVGNEAGKLIALRDLLLMRSSSSGGNADDARPPYLVFANSKQRAAALQRCACLLALPQARLQVQVRLRIQNWAYLQRRCAG